MYQYGDFQINRDAVIGKGANGIVFDCSSDRIVIPLCAKFMKHDRDQVSLQREIDILKDLIVKSKTDNCHNLVKTFLVEHIEQPEKGLLIIMEKCESTLGEKLKAVEKFSPEEAQKIMKEILTGYRYLLKYGIVHRDLKPDNILYQSGVYKIADFGEGKILDNEQLDNVHMTKGKGTPAYQSPQVSNLLKVSSSPTSKADIFSLGLIYFQLLTGCLPFSPEKNKRTTVPMITNFYEKLKEKSFELPNGVVDAKRNLIMRMLAYEESERIGWEDLFSEFQVKQVKPIQIIKHQPQPIIFTPGPMNLSLNNNSNNIRGTLTSACGPLLLPNSSNVAIQKPGGGPPAINQPQSINPISQNLPIMQQCQTVVTQGSNLNQSLNSNIPGQTQQPVRFTTVISPSQGNPNSGSIQPLRANLTPTPLIQVQNLESFFKIFDEKCNEQQIELGENFFQKDTQSQLELLKQIAMICSQRFELNEKKKYSEEFKLVSKVLKEIKSGTINDVNQLENSLKQLRPQNSIIIPG